MSVDKYLENHDRTDDYTCLDFAAEVWQEEVGGLNLKDVLNKYIQVAAKDRDAKIPIKRIKTPVSPCITIFRNLQGDAHIGIYIRNRILHMSDDSPQHVPVEAISHRFRSVKYYIPW